MRALHLAIALAVLFQVVVLGLLSIGSRDGGSEDGSRLLAELARSAELQAHLHLCTDGEE